MLAFIATRRTGCGVPLALALTSSLLVSGAGLAVTTGIRNDALPLVLQLAAVLLVARAAGRGVILVSAALCALALASKLSALWAPVAIVIWLLRRDGRAAGVFAGALGAGIALLYGTFELVSAGRLSENLVDLSLTSPERLGELGLQLDRLRLVGSEGLGLLVLVVGVALVAIVLAARRRPLALDELAFAAACAVTGLVLLDPGAFVNHLWDVQVLALPVVGRLWSEAGGRRAGAVVLRGALVAVLLVGVAGSYREHVSPREDLRVLLGGSPTPADRLPVLDDALRRGDRILSEDPAIPVLRGERPVVLDPYMLIPLLARDPARRDELVAQITGGAFDKVVLLYLPSTAPEWYRNLHLGRAVVDAIEARYRPVRRVDGYWVYEPRPRGTGRA